MAPMGRAKGHSDYPMMVYCHLFFMFPPRRNVHRSLEHFEGAKGHGPAEAGRSIA